MKNQISKPGFIISICILPFLFPSCNMKNKKSFAFKTAHIEYAASGNEFGIKKNTNSSLWIDQYGEWMGMMEVEQKDFSSIGIEETQKATTLYVLNADTLKEFEMAPDINLKKIDYVPLEIPIDPLILNSFSTRNVRQWGGIASGEDTIKSFPCEIYQFTNARIWIHEGLALRTETEILGETIVQEAISVEFNCPIDSVRTVLSKKTNISLTRNIQN